MRSFRLTSPVTLKLKVVEHLLLNGRVSEQLIEFLAIKKAIISGNKHHNLCFGYAVLYALNPKSNKQHLIRPGHCLHLFHHYGIDDILYPVAIEDKLPLAHKLDAVGNVFPLLDDKGEGRQTLYVSEKGHAPVIYMIF